MASEFKIEKGVLVRENRKVCERGHELTPENTQRIGKAGVRCRICRRRITREHHRRKTGVYVRNPGASVPA